MSDSSNKDLIIYQPLDRDNHIIRLREINPNQWVILHDDEIWDRVGGYFVDQSLYGSARNEDLLKYYHYDDASQALIDAEQLGNKCQKAWEKTLASNNLVTWIYHFSYELGEISRLEYENLLEAFKTMFIPQVQESIKIESLPESERCKV